MSAAFVLLVSSLLAAPHEIKPVSIQDATTEEPLSVDGAQITSWTVVAFEGGGYIQAMSIGSSEGALFLGDQWCFLSFGASKSWCIVPRVENASRHGLWGPFQIEVGAERNARFLAEMRRTRMERSVALDGIKTGPPLRAKTLGQLLRSLERD